MLVAFSVTPLGIGEGVGEVVAEAVRVVRDSGLPNRTDAMFTTVEGDWDEAMDVVQRAVEAVAARAPRVSLVLKADIRPGVTGALTAKVEAVERYLSPSGRGSGDAEQAQQGGGARSGDDDDQERGPAPGQDAADQHPGGAGQAGEAMALGQRGGGDQRGQHDHGGSFEQPLGPGRDGQPLAQRGPG